jgi:hypothetical protein
MRTFYRLFFFLLFFPGLIQVPPAFSDETVWKEIFFRGEKGLPVCFRDTSPGKNYRRYPQPRDISIVISRDSLRKRIVRGGGGKTATSPDGIDWTRGNSGTSFTLNG